MKKSVVISLAVLLVLTIIGLNVAIPFAIVFVAKGIFGYQLSFWLVAIAWWLFCVIINTLRGGK